MKRTLITLATLTALVSPLAFAQLKKPPSPAGKWEFKTDVLNDHCTISGEMQITERGQGDTRRFTCSFRAVQACTGGGIKSIVTEQSCLLDQAGTKITIISKVEDIVSTDPPELMKGMDRRYAPDNFAITINSRGDQMEGVFESQGQAPVRFRRKGDFTS